MASANWTWANLDSQQYARLAEAERALGVDYLLAFSHPAAPGADAPSLPPTVAVAPLSESELECLRGLEEQLHTVVVAYRQAA